MELKKVNIVFVITILIYALITLSRVLTHVPWFDESHAYAVARELSVLQLFSFMKTEGQPILWYLILMPFAKTHFHYPYPMLLLNWLFCFSAIIILWLKAPFNNAVKVLITFSYPFLALYSVVARSYALGILFLFILAMMFKNKLKHPNIYATIIILAANTYIMSFYGACAFGCLFIFDLIQAAKNREISLKSTIYPLVILLIGIVFFIISLSGSNTGFVDGAKDIIFIFKNTFIPAQPLINLSLIAVFSIPIVLFCSKYPKSLFFLSFTYVVFYLHILLLYGGFVWHHCFAYVYLIISIWLACLNPKEVNNKIKNAAMITLACISFMLIFSFHDRELKKIIFNSPTKKISEIILNDENLNSNPIIIKDMNGYNLAPYFYNKNIDIVNYCTGKSLNYDMMVLSYSSCCYKTKTETFTPLESQYLKLSIKNKAYFFLDSLSDIGDVQTFTIRGKTEKFMFKKYKCYSKDFCFWEVNKIIENANNKPLGLSDVNL